MPPPLPPVVAALAEANHGILVRRQLLDLPGMTRHRIDNWLRRGLFVSAGRGAYKVVGAPRSRRAEVAALVGRAGRGALAWGSTAAGLWELEGFPLAPRYHLAVPPDRRIVPLGAATVRRTDVAERDRRRRHGIPCVGIERTLVDLAGAHADRAVRVAVDSAIRSGLTTVTKLDRAVADLRRFRGGGRLAAMIARGDFEHESEGERELPRIFRRGDPLPQWQVRVLPGIRVDGAYLEARCVLEYDGRANHLLETDRDNDSIRDLKLAAADILSLRVTKAMVRPDRIAETRERILIVRSQRITAGVEPLVPLRP